jgi:hypothetical protein
MRSICKSLNRSDRNIAVWVAIYTSILFATPHNPSPHHHPVAAPIAAFALILVAASVARIYSQKCKAA